MAQILYDYATFLKDQGNNNAKCNLAHVVSWLVSAAHAQVIDTLLVAKKADIGDRDSAGLTSLIVASRAGIVDILLENGANVYDRDSRGRNSIIHAAIGGHVKTIRELLFIE